MTRVPWAATSRAPFASWLGELPRPRDDADLLRLVDVASAMLDAGRAQRVFDVHAGHGADGFDARRDGPYETWLARRASEQGRLPLFELGWGTGATPEGQLRTPSTLSYPDAAGEVQEAVVEDVGELLRELGLWAPEFERWLAAHVPPLRVHGGTTQAGAAHGVRLTVALPTSVWFPWVRDPYGDDPAWWRNPAGERNAPRLNAFLEATRAAVEQAGGAWVGLDDEDVVGDYRSLVGKHGILLDAAP